MLVRQSKNSFIRIYKNGNIGYITNQLTRNDRTYDEVGAVFLSQISRQPIDTDVIIINLCNIYGAAEKDYIKRDFLEFIENLANHKFVVIGNTIEELDAQDLDFCYQVDNPKTLAVDYTQLTAEQPTKDTQDFFLQQDKESPRLAALQFELTSRCNERCIHCYIPNGKKNTGFDLSFEKFKYILNQFVEMGGLHVKIGRAHV